MKASKYNFEVELSNNRVVVLNTINNQYAVFDKDGYINFRNNLDEYLQNEKDCKKIKCFKKGGFIVDDDRDELQQIKMDYMSKCYNTSVYNVTIIPTTACNFNCSYCFVEDDHKYMLPPTVESTIRYLCRILDEQAPYLKHFNVKWFGGEPTLFPEIIEEISRLIIKKCGELDINYHAMLYSNLSLLSNDTIQLLKKNEIGYVNTTLDGLGDDNDTRRTAKNGKKYFDVIIDNIKKLREFARVNIQVNIDKENRDKIVKLLKYLKDNGIVDGEMVTVGFNLVNDNGYIQNKGCLMNYSAEEDMRIIDDFYAVLGDKATHTLPEKALHCFAVAKNTVVIDPDGKLYKCYKESKTNIPFGTVDDMHTEYSDILYRSLLHDPFKREKCCDCSVLPICYGGCYDINDHKLICSMKYILKNKIKRYFNSLWEEK